MRIFVRWIGASLPLVQIGETVSIGILIEDIPFRDWQAKLLKPVIWHRWVYLCILQRRRQTVGTDKMFFRNEKPRAAAGLPLRRVLELLGGTIKLNSLGGRR